MKSTKYSILMLIIALTHYKYDSLNKSFHSKIKTNWVSKFSDLFHHMFSGLSSAQSKYIFNILFPQFNSNKLPY